MGNQLIKLFIFLLLILSSCASPPSSEGHAPSSPVQEDTSPPRQDEIAETTTTPFPSNLQNLIVKVREDLAKRLSMTPLNIKIVTAIDVTWPDTSLGCPQEGMMYAQVLTDGYLIRLEANQVFYTYHTDTAEQVILCERRELPVFPVKPGEIKDGEPWMPVD